MIAWALRQRLGRGCGIVRVAGGVIAVTALVLIAVTPPVLTAVTQPVLTVRSSSALPATGYVVTQRQGPDVITIRTAQNGIEVVERSRPCVRCGVEMTSQIIANYRANRVLFVDPVHRVYTTASLAQVAASASLEVAQLVGHARIPELGALVTPPMITAAAAGRAVIAGVPAVGFLVRDGSLVRRLWYAAELPSIPEREETFIASFGGRPSSSVVRLLGPEHERLLLRVEVRIRGHWSRLLDTTSVRAVSAPTFSLRPPAHDRPGGFPTKLLVDGGAQAADVPARLRNLGLSPVSQDPQIFAIYWGRFFQQSPGVVSTLNQELEQMASGSDGYTSALTQYGVYPGSFSGSFTLGDPPSSVGGADVGAIEQMLLEHLGGSSPRSWGIFSSTSPIVVIFVPESVVGVGSWSGYHFQVFTEQGGFPWNYPAIPWAIVKVPDTTDPSRFSSMIDMAMENASHEVVEAATDPYPFLAWIDPGKEPVWAYGEAADICSQGNTSPWGSDTRAGGTAYSTYWSNSAASCVPESRPSITITSPASGSVWQCPVLPVAANATDPLDGTVPVNQITWSIDGATAVPQGGKVQVAPGTHQITATATDSQNLSTTSAPATFTVAPAPTPQVTIASPAQSSTWGADQSIPFSGQASDACHAHIPALVWTEGGTPLAFGDSFSMNFPQGQHTITLTATNSEGVVGSRTVTFVVGPPSGNPSPVITEPKSGTQIDINAPVVFSGSATDPHDGTLSGNALKWYDTYSDGVGGGQSNVYLGSGRSFTTKLPWDAHPATHTITLIATDSLGHSATTVVVVSSANIQ